MSRRQPQEKSFFASFVEDRQQLERDFICREENDLKQKVIDSAKEKLIKFTELRAEISAKIDRVEEMIKVIRQDVAANAKSEINQGGLLTQGKEAYLVCLNFSRSKLNQLLSNDETEWCDNVKTTEVEAECLKQKMEAFLKNQST